MHGYLDTTRIQRIDNSFQKRKRNKYISRLRVSSIKRKNEKYLNFNVNTNRRIAILSIPISKSQTSVERRRTTTNERWTNRSTSPARSADVATSKEDLSQLIEPTEHPKNPTAHQFTPISGLQPFTKRKTYRPIFYNPCPTPPIPS